METLRGDAGIATDTTMAMSGINKRGLAKFGGQVYHYIADDDVASETMIRRIVRAAVGMDRAAAMGKPLVYAICNALLYTASQNERE